MEDKIICNPFNFHGSKHRIMPLIKENLPKNCTILVDVFGGSGEICLNLDFKKKFYNDKNTYLFGLIETLKNLPLEYILIRIDSIIEHWQLSKTNKEAFIRFRENFNEKIYKNLWNINKALRQEAFLYVLILCFFSFNHQIIFNKSGKFSVPAGTNRSSYNSSIKQKLIDYKTALDKSDLEMFAEDFRNLYEKIVKVNNDNLSGIFFFVDPIYKISNDVYSRTFGISWTEQDEIDLYNMLQDINLKGGKFILTNQLQKGDIMNHHLLNFSKNFFTINTMINFNNCSYQRKCKTDKEIIVKNY